MSIINRLNRNNLLIGIAVIGIIITGVLIFANSNKGFSISNIFGASDEEIGKKAVDYINNSELSSTPATFVSASSASGLVKIKIKIGESEFDSYATKDGKLLFPQAFEMNPAEGDKAADGKTPPSEEDLAKAAESIVKSANPMLEAFVVARCPYGLQMQRAMADAVANQPSLAQYIKSRYIGSVSGNTITAMHGDAEAQENLRQICIREEQPAKYWGYVACQMKASGQEVSCEKSTGVDSAKLSACISTPSRGVAYAKVDFDLQDKYGVSGSPTLFVNGTQISESGFGGRSSDGVKSMACAGFETKAAFCSTALNTAEAAVSFSATYSSSASASGANSGTDGTNCAPAQ